MLHNLPANAASIRSSKPTLSENAYRLLYSDILDGRLAPTEKLKLQPLQEYYGIGLSPIREALLLLTREGLVINEGQRGFSVAAVSKADLEDIVRSRQHIETELLSDAIDAGDEEWGGQIMATLYKLLHTPFTPRNDPEVLRRWEAAHDRFHSALLAAARSKWLHRMDEQLVVHSERYRRMRFAHHTPDEVLDFDIHDEHERLAEATLSRNKPLACELLCAHIAETAGVIAPYLPDVAPEPTPE